MSLPKRATMPRDEWLDEPGRYGVDGEGVPAAGPFPTRRAALDWASRWAAENRPGLMVSYNAFPLIDPEAT